MASPSTIAVVGSINMDLVATTPRLPEPGETILGTAFTTVPGGKGSNQAIAAAKAGGSVHFVGAVGNDGFAHPLVATLTAADVDVDRLRHTSGSSGIAVISVDDDAENSIIVIPGANATITSLDDDDATAIRRSDLLVLQLEIPLEAVAAAARIAQAAGVDVLLNPSPVQDLPAALVDAVTIAVVNEGEAAALGRDTVAGIPSVVTTLGARGARMRLPDGEQVEVAAPRVAAIDTTGAGDAFTGALAVALAEGRPPRAALQWACAAGALATTVAGASASSPTRAAIDQLVADTYGQSPHDA